MRIKQNGQRYTQDLSAQDFPHNPPAPRQMLLTHTKQYLGYLDWFGLRCGLIEALPVVTVRAALKLLVEYLERNK